MNSRALSDPVRRVTEFSFLMCFSRKVFNHASADDRLDNLMEGMEGPVKQILPASDSNCPLIDTPILNEAEGDRDQTFKGRHQFVDKVRIHTQRVLDVLLQNGQEIDTQALKELRLNVSETLMREVLWGIFRSTDESNRSQCARLGFKFFAWCCVQENYRHTTQGYHLMMEFLAACEECTAVWNLCNEMTEKGLPTTAQTLNVLICASCEDSRRNVKRLLKSEAFKFKPLQFKRSYNAILHCLVTLKRYELIGWVYHRMRAAGCFPDLLTYNVLFCAKHRIRKKPEFQTLFDMLEGGFYPDIHTYNTLLHVLGEKNELGLALNLLNNMKELGLDPCVLHFTTLVDGLSRVKNLDACKCVFGKMIKDGCMPDVVFYTVMITAYVVAGEINRAKKLFIVMKIQGKLPNVFTYNSILRGLCVAGEFADACTVLVEMVSRGCNPNLQVYGTLKWYVNKLIPVLGKQNKLGLAINLLNGVNKVGLALRIGHFTLLLDGLSKARNLDACRVVFGKMIRNGCMHDVVSYTIMITTYMVSGEVDNAVKLFDDMISQGNRPPQAAYISMVHGFCTAGKFDEAYSIRDEFAEAYSIFNELPERDRHGHSDLNCVYWRLGNYIRIAKSCAS